MRLLRKHTGCLALIRYDRYMGDRRGSVDMEALIVEVNLGDRSATVFRFNDNVLDSFVTGDQVVRVDPVRFMGAARA